MIRMNSFFWTKKAELTKTQKFNKQQEILSWISILGPLYCEHDFYLCGVKFVWKTSERQHLLNYWNHLEAVKIINTAHTWWQKS